MLLLDETREDGLQASAHVWTSRRRRLDLTRRENPVDAGLIRMKQSIVGASRPLSRRQRRFAYSFRPLRPGTQPTRFRRGMKDSRNRQSSNLSRRPRPKAACISPLRALDLPPSIRTVRPGSSIQCGPGDPDAIPQSCSSTTTFPASPKTSTCSSADIRKPRSATRPVTSRCWNTRRRAARAP